MRHIAYSSIADNLTADEFAQIVETARQHNEKLGVHGAIAFDGRMITQILEGPGEVVDALYKKITADPRHCGVVLTARADISKTQFSGFGMSRKTPSELYLLSLEIVGEYGEGDTSAVPLASGD